MNRIVLLFATTAVLVLILGCSRDFSADKPEVIIDGVAGTVEPGAELVEVYADDIFFEGPGWDTVTGKLYFVAWADKKQQLMRLDEPGKASVWMDNTDGINGTFLSQDGRLLTAEVNAHKICSYRIGPDGPIDKKTLAHNDSWHQPNDLCQTVCGDIYFTDPDWANRSTSAVYRVSTDGRVSKVIDDMVTTNGIIAGNDGKTLYVSDSAEKLWRSYPIKPDGSVGEGKVFFDPDTENLNDPDGMTIDESGNLYFTGRGGVWIVSPNGKQLGFIEVPEFCSNVTFGGPQRRTLYITCMGKVYSLATAVRGAGSSR